MNKVMVTLEGSAKATKEPKKSAKNGWLVMQAAGKAYGKESNKNRQIFMWEVLPIKSQNKEDLIRQYNEEAGEENFGEDYVDSTLHLAGNEAFVLAPGAEPKKVSAKSLGKDISIQSFVAFNNRDYEKYEAPVYKIGGKFYVTDQVYEVLVGM